MVSLTLVRRYRELVLRMVRLAFINSQYMAQIICPTWLISSDDYLDKFSSKALNKTKKRIDSRANLDKPKVTTDALIEDHLESGEEEEDSESDVEEMTYEDFDGFCNPL